MRSAQDEVQGIGARVPVRGTQSFVHTLSWCWRRPGLTAFEIAWRWLYGIPACWLIWVEARRVAASAVVDWAGVKNVSVTDPMASAQTLALAGEALLGPALQVGVWLALALVAVWIVVASAGRTVLLLRIGRESGRGLHARPGTVMVLQTVRMVALGAGFLVWFSCLRGASSYAVRGPMAAGEDPNLVLYAALAIVATLGLFTLWAVASWALAAAPLVAMLRDLGAVASLRAAWRLGPLRAKLVEINLVMGIVKIALIVLAMVFSATPLPFESVATPEFMAYWYAGVTVLYLVASDFFHVVRLASYLELWRAFEPRVPEER